MTTDIESFDSILGDCGIFIQHDEIICVDLAASFKKLQRSLIFSDTNKNQVFIKGIDTFFTSIDNIYMALHPMSYRHLVSKSTELLEADTEIVPSIENSNDDAVGLDQTTDTFLKFLLRFRTIQKALLEILIGKMVVLSGASATQNSNNNSNSRSSSSYRGSTHNVVSSPHWDASLNILNHIRWAEAIYDSKSLTTLLSEVVPMMPQYMQVEILTAIPGLTPDGDIPSVVIYLLHVIESNPELIPYVLESLTSLSLPAESAAARTVMEAASSLLGTADASLLPSVVRFLLENVTLGTVDSAMDSLREKIGDFFVPFPVSNATVQYAGQSGGVSDVIADFDNSIDVVQLKAQTSIISILRSSFHTRSALLSVSYLKLLERSKEGRPSSVSGRSKITPFDIWMVIILSESHKLKSKLQSLVCQLTSTGSITSVTIRSALLGYGASIDSLFPGMLSLAQTMLALQRQVMAASTLRAGNSFACMLYDVLYEEYGDISSSGWLSTSLSAARRQEIIASLVTHVGVASAVLRGTQTLDQASALECRSAVELLNRISDREFHARNRALFDPIGSRLVLSSRVSLRDFMPFLKCLLDDISSFRSADQAAIFRVIFECGIVVRSVALPSSSTSSSSSSSSNSNGLTSKRLEVNVSDDVLILLKKLRACSGSSRHGQNYRRTANIGYTMQLAVLADIADTFHHFLSKDSLDGVVDPAVSMFAEMLNDSAQPIPDYCNTDDRVFIFDQLSLEIERKRSLEGADKRQYPPFFLVYLTDVLDAELRAFTRPISLAVEETCAEGRRSLSIANQSLFVWGCNHGGCSEGSCSLTIAIASVVSKNLMLSMVRRDQRVERDCGDESEKENDNILQLTASSSSLLSPVGRSRLFASNGATTFAPPIALLAATLRLYCTAASGCGEASFNEPSTTSTRIPSLTSALATTSGLRTRTPPPQTFNLLCRAPIEMPAALRLLSPSFLGLHNPSPDPNPGPSGGMDTGSSGIRWDDATKERVLIALLAAVDWQRELLNASVAVHIHSQHAHSTTLSSISTSEHTSPVAMAAAVSDHVAEHFALIDRMNAMTECEIVLLDFIRLHFSDLDTNPPLFLSIAKSKSQFFTATVKETAPSRGNKGKGVKSGSKAKANDADKRKSHSTREDLYANDDDDNNEVDMDPPGTRNEPVEKRDEQYLDDASAVALVIDPLTRPLSPLVACLIGSSSLSSLSSLSCSRVPGMGLNVCTRNATIDVQDTEDVAYAGRLTDKAMDRIVHLASTYVDTLLTVNSAIDCTAYDPVLCSIVSASSPTATAGTFTGRSSSSQSMVLYVTLLQWSGALRAWAKLCLEASISGSEASTAMRRDQMRRHPNDNNNKVSKILPLFSNILRSQALRAQAVETVTRLQEPCVPLLFKVLEDFVCKDTCNAAVPQELASILSHAFHALGPMIEHVETEDASADVSVTLTVILEHVMSICKELLSTTGAPIEESDSWSALRSLHEELSSRLGALCDSVIKRHWRPVERVSSSSRAAAAAGCPISDKMISTLVSWSIKWTTHDESWNQIESLAVAVIAAFGDDGGGVENANGENDLLEYHTLSARTLPLYLEQLLKALTGRLAVTVTDAEETHFEKKGKKGLVIRPNMQCTQIVEEIVRITSTFSTLMGVIKGEHADSKRAVLYVVMCCGGKMVQCCLASFQLVSAIYAVDSRLGGKILTTVQKITRPLHQLCAHARSTRDKRLTGEAPLVKRLLEQFVHRARVLLVTHDDDIRVGALRVRGLDGGLLREPSSSPATTKRGVQKKRNRSSASAASSIRPRHVQDDDDDERDTEEEEEERDRERERRVRNRHSDRVGNKRPRQSRDEATESSLSSFYIKQEPLSSPVGADNIIDDEDEGDAEEEHHDSEELRSEQSDNEGEGQDDHDMSDEEEKDDHVEQGEEEGDHDDGLRVVLLGGRGGRRRHVSIPTGRGHDSSHEEDDDARGTLSLLGSLGHHLGEEEMGQREEEEEEDDELDRLTRERLRTRGLKSVRGLSNRRPKRVLEDEDD